MRFPTLLLCGVLALSATASTVLLQHQKKADTELSKALETRTGKQVVIPLCPGCKETAVEYCSVSNSASSDMLEFECNAPGATRKKCSLQSGYERKSAASTALYPTVEDTDPVPCEIDLFIVCKSLTPGSKPIWIDELPTTWAVCGVKPACETGAITNIEDYNLPRCRKIIDE